MISAPLTGIVSSLPVSIRSIQTVLATQASAVASSTLSFGSLTNAAQCIPFISGKFNASAPYSDSDPGEVNRAIDIYTSSGVKADILRDAAATGGAGQDLALTLFEFPPFVTVAKYTYNGLTIGASDYIDCAITAVDTSKSFIVCTGQRVDDDGSGGIRAQTGGFCAKFTSSTNVRVHCVNNGASVPKIILYVVTDLTGLCFTVTSTAGTLAGSVRSTNITVPAHDQSKTLAIVNWQASGGSAGYPNNTFLGKHTWSCYESSNTNFVMSCFNVNAGPYIAQYNIQLVTFTTGVTVQQGRVQPAVSNSTTNVTITSVNTSKSAALSYLSHHIPNAKGEADNAGCPGDQVSWKLRLSSSTNLEATRYAGAMPLADLGWQVITTT